MSFASGRGTIERISDTTAQIKIQYIVRTSLLFPCEYSAFERAVRVGLNGNCGDGSSTCVQCEKSRRGSYFKGLSDLRRDVQTSGCLVAQCRSMGLPTEERVADDNESVSDDRLSDDDDGDSGNDSASEEGVSDNQHGDSDVAHFHIFTFSL